MSRSEDDPFEDERMISIDEDGSNRYKDEVKYDQNVGRL